MRDMTIVSGATPNSLAAAGHYAQAVNHAGLVDISGPPPVATDGRHHPEADFDTQALQTIRSLITVAETADASFNDLLKVKANIVDAATWPRFNAVYAQVLGDFRLARSVVPVPERHYGYRVRIDAVAACKD